MSLRNGGKNAAKIWHRCKSLIINGLSGRVAVRNLCLKRNRKKRLSYSTRTRLKIQWWMQIWHFWVKSSWALYRGGQERDTTVNIYSHLQNSTGSVMVWSCVSTSDVGDLDKTDGITNIRLWSSMQYRCSAWKSSQMHFKCSKKYTWIEKKHTMEHYQSWIGLPRARTSILLKQGGIIGTENRAKSSQHPKKSFKCPSRSIPVEITRKTCLKEFRLFWRIKAGIPNIDFFA